MVAIQKRGKYQVGFTLLELVIALALSALVSLIGAMALSAGVDFFSRNNTRQNSVADLRSVERRIRVEWASRGPYFKMTDGTIVFDTTISLSRRSSYGYKRVIYKCEKANNSTYTLKHAIVDEKETKRNNGDRNINKFSNDIEVEEVMTNLTECEFSALVNLKKTAENKLVKWVTLWNQDESPPLLLSLKLTGNFGNKPHYVFVAPR